MHPHFKDQIALIGPVIQFYDILCYPLGMITNPLHTLCGKTVSKAFSWVFYPDLLRKLRILNRSF